MMKYILCLKLLSFIASTVVASKNKKLQAWYEKITDQKFNCPLPTESELNPENGQPILKVVDCDGDDPSATYIYDYKVHQCQFSEHKIAKISEWSKSILQSQDDKRLNEILDKSRIDSKNEMEVIDKYYETAAKPLQGK